MSRTHPVNGDVTSDYKGIWGGDDLPILRWESPHQRVVLPTSLADVLPVNTPVTRWSAEKLEALAEKRPDVIEVVNRLSEELVNWSVAGIENHTGNWRVLFVGSDKRFYAVSFGVDATGSWNAITIVGSSKPSFWRNRTQRLTDVKVRADNRW